MKIDQKFFCWSSFRTFLTECNCQPILASFLETLDSFTAHKSPCPPLSYFARCN